MPTTVTAADEGKPVIDSNGDRLGTVAVVEEDVAFVEPDGRIRPAVVAALGWSGEQQDYPLRNTAIATVTESGIHLRSNL